MKGGASYAPQSATVQGILKDMYETFSADLESATNDEATKNRLFEDFIATKQQELIELKETLAKKEEEKAEAEFFDATKAGCEAKNAEWTVRAELRAEEVE